MYFISPALDVKRAAIDFSLIDTGWGLNQGIHIDERARPKFHFMPAVCLYVVYFFRLTYNQTLLLVEDSLSIKLSVEPFVPLSIREVTLANGDIALT